MMTQLMLLEEAHRQQAEQGGGQGGFVVPPNKNGGAEPLPMFWCRKTLLWMYLTIPVTLATSEQLPQTT